MTPTQAVSSMLAAMTGAVAASRLGIAGTLIGAAFMSLASTVGSAFYKHYITSSNERLRAAAATFAPKASHSAVAAASREQAQRYPVREYGAPGVRGPGYVSPDGTQTQIIGALPLNGEAASVRTRGLSEDQHEPADTVGDVAAAGPGRPGDTVSWPWTRRRWLMVAAMALSVFVLAMGAVTVVEALAGKPLDAVVWHQHDSGTTVGSLVDGSGGHHHPSPSSSPSPSHSPGPSHSPSPSDSPSSSPSPTSTSPTSPTPTSSGSPSPSSSTTDASSPPANPSAPTARSASPGASSPGQ